MAAKMALVSAGMMVTGPISPVPPSGRTPLLNTYEPFDVVVNEDNYMPPEWGIFGPMFVNGGGHYARMQPLTPGDHVLELGGSLCDGEVTWVDISATYHLHIGE